MKLLNKIIMTVIGLVLIAAGILKAHQILTTIIPTIAEIQSKYTGFEFFMRVLESREFMIFHVPLEIGLGVWLICGLFRKAGWLIGLITFIFFCFITGYKVINGYADCGCFGVVKIPPIITFSVVDIPAAILLAIFYPRGYKLLPPPWPRAKYFFAIAVPTIIALVAITIYLFTAPPIEPDPLDEVGSQWDKLEHIDIADKLKAGMWVVLMYHNDCPNCVEAIPEYEKIIPDFQDSVNFAFIEIPPYTDSKYSIVSPDSPATLGRLDESKKWMIQTPRILLLVDGQVINIWEIDAPTIEEILESVE